MKVFDIMLVLHEEKGWNSAVVLLGSGFDPLWSLDCGTRSPKPPAPDRSECTANKNPSYEMTIKIYIGYYTDSRSVRLDIYFFKYTAVLN